MIKVALLNDYQRVAMGLAPWEELSPRATVQAFHDHQVDADALVERLADYDVVMAMRERTPFPRTLLERLPKLKLIASAGMRNAAIDMEAATELGIVVCGTAGGLRPTMELSWGLIFAITRRIALEHQAMREGAWQAGPLGVTLEGRTLGLAGLGNIGAQMAEVARAFRMDVTAWSEHLTDERAAECGARRVSREELLRGADIVSIHLRLSGRSRDLFGASDLALMKPTAYLINTSRGPIVTEQALIEALRTGKIAGAGLDVYDEEPLPADHPLRSLDNVVLTPHSGYVTEEVYGAFYRETLENIQSWLDGEPRRVIDPDVLPRARRPEA